MGRDCHFSLTGNCYCVRGTIANWAVHHGRCFRFSRLSRGPGTNVAAVESIIILQTADTNCHHRRKTREETHGERGLDISLLMRNDCLLYVHQDPWIDGLKVPVRYCESGSSGVSLLTLSIPCWVRRTEDRVRVS